MATTSFFDVIFSFEGLEQVLVDEVEVRIPCKEPQFVAGMLSLLSDEELKQLVKISACQHSSSDADALEWFNTRSGRFFFNVEDNEDPDTARWASFKKQYIKKFRTPAT